MAPINVGSDHCRVVPLSGHSSLAEQIQFLRHYFAYTQATNWLQPAARVLEVGTGEGYGANHLADSGANVIGTDLSWEALKHSTRQYPRIRFLLALAEHLPFLTSSFDLVISFQVIEHIPFVSLFLDEVYRVLRPGGWFVLTTPNRKLRLMPFQKPINPYHVTEYTGRQLRRLLRSRFSHVEIRGLTARPEITEFIIAQYKQNPIKVYGGMVKKTMRKILPSVELATSRSKSQSSHQLHHEPVDPGAYGVHEVSLDDFRLSLDLDRALDLFAIVSK